MNAQDKLDQQLLYSGSFKNIQHWISLGANINAQDSIGNSLLHIWGLRRETSELEELIKMGIKVDMINDESQTPFHYITSYYNFTKLPEAALKRIKILLESGADPNKTDSQGNTPLDYLEPATQNRVRALMAEVTKQKMDKIIPKSKQTQLETPTNS